MFEKISVVKENLIGFLNLLSESPGSCVFLLILSFLISYLWTASLVYSLFRVHRSKTACRKIMKEYSFWQKALLIPHKTHCLHAKKFCAKIIYCLYVHAAFVAIGFISVIFESIVSEQLTISIYFLIIDFLAFALPEFVAELILEEKPWLRFNKKYRFEKYHHTKEFEKLI